VERTTRYLMLLRLERYSADEVREAMAKKILTLPETLRRSITWDQGKEMAAHARFTIDTGVQVYFCDPHQAHRSLIFVTTFWTQSRTFVVNHTRSSRVGFRDK